MSSVISGGIRHAPYVLFYLNDSGSRMGLLIIGLLKDLTDSDTQYTTSLIVLFSFFLRTCEHDLASLMLFCKSWEVRIKSLSILSSRHRLLYFYCFNRVLILVGVVYLVVSVLILKQVVFLILDSIVVVTGGLDIFNSHLLFQMKITLRRCLVSRFLTEAISKMHRLPKQFFLLYRRGLF